MSTKLYDKIFDIADTKMREHEMQFSYSKKAFNSILYHNPVVVHVDEFTDMDIKDYLDALYLRCLNRLPDSFAYELMEQYTNNSYDVFLGKYILLSNVSNSIEFMKMGKTLVGQEEMRQNLLNGSLKTRILLRRMELLIQVKYYLEKYLLFPIWRRIPDGIKNIIRRVMSREKK